MTTLACAGICRICPVTLPFSFMRTFLERFSFEKGKTRGGGAGGCIGAPEAVRQKTEKKDNAHNGQVYCGIAEDAAGDRPGAHAQQCQNSRGGQVGTPQPDDKAGNQQAYLQERKKGNAPPEVDPFMRPYPPPLVLEYEADCFAEVAERLAPAPQPSGIAVPSKWALMRRAARQTYSSGQRSLYAWQCIACLFGGATTRLFSSCGYPRTSRTPSTRTGRTGWHSLRGGRRLSVLTPICRAMAVWRDASSVRPSGVR